MWFRPLSNTVRDVFDRDRETILAELERVRLAVGGVLQAGQLRVAPTLREAESRVFSRFEEDGVIAWLLARVPIADRSFVEFGVEDYRELKTRFLSEQGGWRGLIIDGGTAHIDFVRQSGLLGRALIEARQAFVTAECIND